MTDLPYSADKLRKLCSRRVHWGAVS